MCRALRLAERGRGRVEPNPMVGCVFVRDGRVVAEGYHHRFGGPHAEANALEKCRRHGLDPAGCDVYVNLEPCPHHGKTPPCVDALIDAQARRVYVAMIDPYSRVAGRGVEKVRAAGIDVVVGLEQQRARRLNEPYIKRTKTGLPWVAAKWAQTIDGAIATGAGDSRWISNERSRLVVHRLRARMDAIVVGIGTVIADNPLLTARDVPVRRVARRVVVDPHLRLPVEAKLVESLDAEQPLTVAVTEQLFAQRPDRMQQLASRGVEFIGLPSAGDDPSRLQLCPLLKHLAGARCATNVLVEGGSQLLGSLLRQQLLDQALVFLAPKLLGDAKALPAVRGMTRKRIEEANRFELRQVRRLGDDLMLDYRTVAGSEEKAEG